MDCNDVNYNELNIEFLIELRLNIEREYITLTNILDQKKDLLERLTKIISKKCDHKWCLDNIDQMINYKEDIQIKYCEKCLLTDSAC